MRLAYVAIRDAGNSRREERVKVGRSVKILYQSPNYDPDKITNRYLRIDIGSGKPVVSETIKRPKTNYTQRSYELPEEEWPRYSKAIADANKIKRCWPNEVAFVEDDYGR